MEGLVDRYTNRRRVFVRVKNASDLVRDLSTPPGLFVATRLSLSLGDYVILAVSLPECARAVELPAIVIARRLPRGAQRLLASGVVVRIQDPAHPMFDLIRDYAEGRVVDLSARVRDQQRVEARSTFSSFESLTEELRSLLTEDVGIFPIAEGVVYPQDRVHLRVGTPEVDDVLTLELVVRGLAHHDGRRGIRTSLVDGNNVEELRHFLTSTAPASLLKRS